MPNSYEDYDEDQITEIQKTVINNTLTKTDINLDNININSLQQAAEKVLQKYDCQCDECGTPVDEVGGVLQFRQSVDAFPTKEDALSLDNMTLICVNCYDDYNSDASNSSSTSVKDRVKSSVKGSKEQTAKQMKASSLNFEVFVANNTPSLFVKKNVTTAIYSLLFACVILFGYGVATGDISSGFNLAGSVLGTVVNTVVFEYTFLFFLGLIPIIGIYTLLEYYQPPSYFLPDYKTGYSLGPITVPYIFHPVMLAISTSAWIGVGYLSTENIIQLTEEVTAFVVFPSLLISIVLLVTLPRVFVKLVRSDKSTLLSRSVLSHTGAIAEKHGEVYIQDSKAKPAIKADYVREVFANDEELYGDYYYPVLWIFLVHLSVVYAFFTFILSGELFFVLEALFVFSPVITVVGYIIYRYVVFKLVAEELEETADEIKSELGLQTENLQDESESESEIEFRW